LIGAADRTGRVSNNLASPDEFFHREPFLDIELNCRCQLLLRTHLTQTLQERNLPKEPIFSLTIINSSTILGKLVLKSESETL